MLRVLLSHVNGLTIISHVKGLLRLSHVKGLTCLRAGLGLAEPAGRETEYTFLKFNYTA